MSDELANQVCEVCQVGAPPLTEAELAELDNLLPEWDVIEVDGVNQLKRQFMFGNYSASLEFVNQIAKISEQFNHHPAMLLEWGKVEVVWWTHKINGLHKTDTIMAAKTDQIFNA